MGEERGDGEREWWAERGVASNAAPGSGTIYGGVSTVAA